MQNLHELSFFLTRTTGNEHGLSDGFSSPTTRFANGKRCSRIPIGGTLPVSIWCCTMFLWVQSRLSAANMTLKSCSSARSSLCCSPISPDSFPWQSPSLCKPTQRGKNKTSGRLGPPNSIVLKQVHNFRADTSTIASHHSSRSSLIMHAS